MKGYLDFVVKTVDGRYNNKKSIEGEELILNTELENHNYVSRIAEVVYEPYKNKTGIIGKTSTIGLKIAKAAGNFATSKVSIKYIYIKFNY